MIQGKDGLEIKGRPLYSGVLAVVFAVLAILGDSAALGLFHTDRIHNVADRVAAMMAASGFVLVAIGLIRRAIALNGTTVTISPAGFIDRRISTEMIPWHAVSQLDTLWINRRPYLAFRLTPDFQEDADRAAMRSLLFRFKTLRQPNGRHLMSARGLAISSDGLVQAMMSSRNAAIEQMSDGEKAAMIQRPHDATSDILFDLKGKRPYLSFALLAVLIAIYAVEVALAGSGGTPGHRVLELTPRDLVLDGGLSKNLIDLGQYWRFFTAPMLHLNTLHILGNGVALIFGGYLLERLIGWRWYGAIFAISALTGGLASYLWDPVGVVSVGASGGIVGLFAAAVIVAFHYPTGALRTAMTTGAMRILIPTMLPFLHRGGAGPVDVAAHVGGALGGALIGLIILKLWSDDGVLKRGLFPLVATGVFAMSAIASFAIAAEDRDAILALIAQRRTAAQAFDLHLPSDFQQQVTQSAALIKAYPRDPRVRYARAAALYNDDHNQEAKALLVQTLADQALLKMVPKIEAPVRQLLSMIDEADGDAASAKAAVAPLCGPTNMAFGAAKASLCK